MNGIAAAWSALLAENRPEAGWHRRRLEAASSHDFHAAVLQPGGRPALLLEVPSADIPADFEAPVSKGFEAWAEPVRPGPTGAARLCLVLTDPVYRAVFAVLCDDVVGAAVPAGSAREAVRVWARRLHTWLAFMRRFDPGGLPENAVIGLIAELHALRQHVIPAIGAAGAIAAWRGPQGAPHDFVLGRCDLEVKGTGQNPPRRVDIANLEQLAVRSSSGLLLGVFAVLEDDDGTSLPEAVALLRAEIAAHAPEAIPEFDDRLLLAGYSDAQSDLYRKRRAVRGTSFYRIEEGFPRLEPGDVPAGVEAVRYAVDLALAARYRQPLETVSFQLAGAEAPNGP